MVPLGIIFFSGYNVFLRADINAKMAFLAQFFVDFYETFQKSILQKAYNL